VLRPGVVVAGNEPPEFPAAADRHGEASRHLHVLQVLGVGTTPSEAELESLGKWLNERPEFASPTRPLYATDSLPRDYPPAAAFSAVASGLLAVPLSRTHRNLCSGSGQRRSGR